MLLALDSSTSHASIALVSDTPAPDAFAPEHRVLAELTWEIGRRHSQELVPRLQWLVAACGAQPTDLTAIAVALGPGSFNGLRVGVATAKALAFALGLPLYGASTLDVIAWGHRESAQLAALTNPTSPAAPDRVPVAILSVLDAGRGEVYSAQYVAVPHQPLARWTQTAGTSHVAAGLWRTAEPGVASPTDLAATTPGPVLLCGEWRPATGAALTAAFGPRALLAQAPGGRRASWLAALALDRRARGAADEPATIEPRYLRRPAITRSARHPMAGADEPTPAAPRRDLGEEGDKGESRALRH